MAEALQIDQFNIHAYLIFLHLLPILITKLCRVFIRSQRDRNLRRWREAARKEKLLTSYLRGPHNQHRRKRPPPGRSRTPVRNRTHWAGVATDDTSWWPRLLKTTVKPTSTPSVYSMAWPTMKPTSLRNSRIKARLIAQDDISFPRTMRCCAMHSATHHGTLGAKHCRFDTDSFKIGVDNHASRCMTNDIRHFERFKPLKTNAIVGGIQGGLAIRGEGTFVFNIEDDEGKTHTIRIPNSLYVPELPMSLLSPQHWAQEANDNTPIQHGTRMENFADGCKLIWNQLDFAKTIPFEVATNTPVFRTAPSTCSYCAFAASAEDLDDDYYQTEVTPKPSPGYPRRVTPPTPDEFIAEETINMPENGGGTSPSAPTEAPTQQTTISPPVEATSRTRRAGALTFNPTPEREPDEEFDLAAANPQAELMRWHYRLGHLSFPKLKTLAELGEIPKRLAKVVPPKCAGCIFGAMTKVAWKGKAEQRHIFVATMPGECVSVDQMISTQVGFIAQLKGKLTRDRYKAATIFVDHYSRLRFVHLMRDLTSEETINAKLAFEQYARDHGVTIKHYHADNGRFADNAFKSSCERERQQLTFCGVNAHFQNGIAERAIRDLQEVARKQLLHAHSRWPAAIHLSLWPYALRNAMAMHNSLPVLDDGTSRSELFSGIRVGTRMRSIHTFGCPVFALRNELAGGNSLPKWAPRARLGLNLGPSMMHARNVSLVLNLATGLVSPQYHCNFDDFFETTKLGQSDITVASIWQRLAGFVHISETTPPQMTTATAGSNTKLAEANIHTDQPQEVIFDNSNPLYDPEAEDIVVPNVGTGQPTSAPTTQPTTPATPPTPDNLPYDSPTNVSSRGRQRRVTQAMRDSINQRNFYGERSMHYMAAQADTHEDTDDHTPDYLHDEHLSLQESMSHPIAFHAQMTGDIMYLHQALQQSDSAEFVKAVVKEINGHVDNNNWKIVPRSEVPVGATVVPAVWSLRRKRDLTTNAIVKYKARLNLHGGKQEFGVNYFDTYAPVITWFAVRLMLMFGIINGWAMRQVDFVMAYPQAPIEMPMYMDFPPGIHTTLGDSKDYVLLLLNNLYGQKQAGRVWNQYLVDKLTSIGFKQSHVDECVFYRGGIIFIVYVDDGIFMGKSDDEITAAIEDLKALDLNIEDQGHPADYVGVSIKQHKDGTYELTQRALIDSIIADAGLTDAKVKPVPAKVSVQLHAFKGEAPFNLNFNYRSIVGKLNYLAQTTRPYIMYATHQIAKYSADPREPHGDAILYLVRYLKKTRDVGIRFNPDQTQGFECYCDADFSGNWNRDLAHNDPSTAKSRSGWIIYYAGCPIAWASKLQSQVALSTTEAEYIAMSMALRDVLPIMHLVTEMKGHGFPVLCTEPYVFCKVFEDNSGALELARLPKLRPRTKHINVVYHHFREAVRRGDVKIFSVDTGDQVADVLTKALPQNLFVRHRIKMCGQ